MRAGPNNVTYVLHVTMSFQYITIYIGIFGLTCMKSQSYPIATDKKISTNLEFQGYHTLETLSELPNEKKKNRKNKQKCKG